MVDFASFFYFISFHVIAHHFIWLFFK